MKRSIWKLPFIHSVFFKKSNPLRHPINIMIRNSIIPFCYLNKHITIYNGIWCLGLDITKFQTGFKFGEFAFTKRSDSQVQSRRKSKKKSKKKK